jgi:hypothetical protein
VFQLLRVANNYRDLAIDHEVKKEVKTKKEVIDVLKEIKTRAAKKNDKNDRKVLSCAYDIVKISEALR